MRQNLTNVKETQLDKVDSFYIVGSTTKEGLIEGRSNVKIDLKKAVAEGGGGSEDAQKLFEMVFGQVPYVFYNGMADAPLPLTEYSYQELIDIVHNHNSAMLIYKEQEPIGKAGRLGENYGVSVSFIGGDLEMLETPISLPDGPWYYPEIKADVDLSGFSMPTEENPTLLTGVTIPQKEKLVVKTTLGIQEYTWDSESNRYSAEWSGKEFGIAIPSDSNDWMWYFGGIA